MIGESLACGCIYDQVVYEDLDTDCKKSIISVILLTLDSGLRDQEWSPHWSINT